MEYVITPSHILRDSTPLEHDMNDIAVTNVLDLFNFCLLGSSLKVKSL